MRPSIMAFDPYSAWLDLPPGPRPPDPYTLLGLPRFERDPRRIVEAAEARTRQVGRRATFDRAAEMRDLLEEIDAASDLLTAPSRRRRAKLQAEATLAAPSPAEAAPPRVRTAPTTATVERPRPVVPVTRTLARPAPERAPARREPRRRLLLGLGLAGTTAGVLALGAAAWRWRETSATVEQVAEAKPPAVVNRGGDIETRAATPERPHIEPVVAVKPSGVIQTAPEEVAAARRTVAIASPAPVEAPKPAVPSVADYRVPAFASDADRDAYAAHLRDLLYEAFDQRSADPSSLERHAASAAALAPGAPLTEYAAALASWKRLRFSDAEAHLRAALGGESDPFLPAWRALVRLQWNRNRRAEALETAVAFARLLDGAAARAETREPALASARWLGRLIAALESPWLPEGKRPRDVTQTDAAIREALGPVAERAYDEGREAVGREYAARAAGVEAAVADLRIDHEDRRVQALDEIAQARDTTQDQREKVSRTAAEWKDWFDTQTKEIDGELSNLATAFQQLSVEAEAASITYWDLNVAVTQMLTPPAGSGAAGGARPLLVGGANLPALIAARDQALVQMQAANDRLRAVREKAQALLAKRQSVVATFERETKTLTAKSDSLRKWENILKKRAEATDAEKVTDTPAAKALRRRLNNAETYAPFDLDAERQAVLDALKAAG